MAAELIYVVEDDADIRDLACRALRDYGYVVEGFGNGKSAERAIERCRPDLLLVDLGLPDMDGMNLVRGQWGNARVGVIIVTGRGALSDRVLGLEVGADDYLTKPFEPRELVARCASVIRRLSLANEASGGNKGRASFSGWSFDPDTLSLTSPEGLSESLSVAESQLLTAFLNAPKRVLSRDQLLGANQRDSQSFDRSVDVRVSRLRNKLKVGGEGGDSPIKTVYGAGYLLACDVEWE